MKKLLNLGAIAFACMATLTFTACDNTDDELSLQKNGVLSTRITHVKWVLNGDTTESTINAAGCSFTNAAGQSLDAGTPTFNGKTMQPNDVVGEYYYFLGDTAANFWNGGGNFNVPGSEDLPAFTYDMGAHSDFRIAMPTTVVKANGVSFTATTPSSFVAKKFDVTIQDKNSVRATKTFTSNNISFSAAELSALSTDAGDNCMIYMEAISETPAEGNGISLKLQRAIFEQQSVDIQ